MTVSLTFLAGSGSIGDINPGWSVQEDATPVAPGVSSAGTGQVSLECGYGIDSEFVIDNPSVFSHDNLGGVFGKVDVANPSGMQESLSSGLSIQTNTTLQRLNVDRVADTVWFDNNAVVPSVYVGANTGRAAEPYGISVSHSSDIYVTSNGAITAKTGPNTGLLVDRYKVMRYDAITGALLGEWGTYGVGSGAFTRISGVAVNWASGYTVYVYDGGQGKVHVFTSTGTWVASYGSQGTGNGQFNVASTTGRIATDSSGNYYVTDTGNSRLQKFSNVGTYLGKIDFVGWSPSATPYGLTVDDNDNVIVTLLNNVGSNNQNQVRIYNSSLVLQSSFSYNYDPGTAPTTPGNLNGLGQISAAPGGTSFWANPLWANFAVLLDYSGNELKRYYSRYPLPVDANDKYALASVGDTLYMYAQGLPNQSTSIFYNFSDNLMQGFNFTPISLSAAIQRYIDMVDPALVIDYQATHDPDVLFPGWSGNLWGKLNELCSAYALEISLVEGVITVRDVGSLVNNVDDATAGSSRLSLDTTATGRSINITNYNTTSGSGIAWNAADSGTVFSVEAGETFTETVSTNSYLVYVNQPAQTSNVIVLPGQYYVIASDGLPVPIAEWKNYGGSVTVAISETVPGGIDITLKGPNVEIPGVPAPYSLGISDGSTTRPAFSITGMGVFTNPQIINLLTGADPEKTGQEVAQDIDNIFIGSLERAYDRGAWACALASGPQIGFSTTVPSHPTSILGFGEVAGSISALKGGKYRVTSASTGNATATLNYAQHVTTGDFDAAWAAKTTGQFDTLWAANDTIDVKIKPLRTS